MANQPWRPRKYNTVEDMETAIKEYFEKCDTNNTPYTMAGLASSLGFYGRQELLNYLNYVDENDKSFSDSIKRAKAKCEEKLVTNMLTNNYNATTGIFLLKNNYGYKDKQEIENTGEQNFNLNIKVVE